MAGGSDDHNLLSSTEQMVEDSDVWSMTFPLPRALREVRGVTLGNILYMSGGSYFYCIMYSGIIICIKGVSYYYCIMSSGINICITVGSY